MEKEGKYYIADKNLEKKDYEYLCPVCRHIYKDDDKSYVFLKHGHKSDDNPQGKIPHFAHYFKVLNHYWENESIRD